MQHMLQHTNLLLVLLLSVHIRQPTLVGAAEVSSTQTEEETCRSGYETNSEGSCVSVPAAAAMQLDPYALENYVLKHQIVVVSFSRAADGKSRLLAPELAKAASDAGSTGIKFVNVDVAEHVLASSIYGITTVPTLRFFIEGRMEEEDYTGRRLAQDILAAAAARAGNVKNSHLNNEAPSQIVELSATTLQQITHDLQDVSLFVLYYSSPCAALFLEVEAVARTFAAHKNITVAKLDVFQYPDAFARYSTYSTPLMVFYGQADPFFGFKPKQVVYADLRVASAMVRFLNRKCGMKELVERLEGMVEEALTPYSIPGVEDRDAPAWIFTAAGDT